MLHNILVIQTAEQFNNIYNDFKDSAKINSATMNEIFLVGLDTEYISKDNNLNSFDSCLNWVLKADKIAVCKLQLSTKKMSLVIDLCKFNKQLPDNLIKIITKESWIKTGVGISNDLKYLSYNFDLGQCNGGIDIKIFAELKGCMNPNLLDVYKNVSNNMYGDYLKKIKKSKKHHQNIDWSLDLTMEQIEYAGMDAYMSYIIGEYLITGLMSPQFDKFKCNIADNNDTNRTNDSNKQIIIATSLVSKNYIGILQEYSQKNKIELPVYQDINCDNKNYKFKISCKFKDIITFGYGDNKKEAKTSSARKMLQKLNII